MPVTLDEQMSLRTAYLIMYAFAVRYWERGSKSDKLTDFIANIGPVLEDQTADPAQIGDWLSAAEEVLAGRLTWTGSVSYAKIQVLIGASGKCAKVYAAVGMTANPALRRGWCLRLRPQINGCRCAFQ